MNAAVLLLLALAPQTLAIRSQMQKVDELLNGQMGRNLTSSGPVKGGTINAMQWSAHWKCFNAAPPFYKETCEPQVEALLPSFLENYHLDFVNLGMFQDYAWTAPAPYESVDFICSSDNVRFLYDTEKWDVYSERPLDRQYARKEPLLESEASPSDVFGCSNANRDGGADRVYAVMGFERKIDKEKVIVAVGHFPHPPGGTSSAESSVSTDTEGLLKSHIGAKINNLKELMGPGTKVVLIADLNNDVSGPMDRALFDSADNIKEAFTVMDEKTVGQIKAMKGQVAGLDGKPLPVAVSEALDVPNVGWVTQPIMDNNQVWDALELGTSLGSATDPIGTCCADKPGKRAGDDEVFFPYAFDRILASFGTLDTIQPLQDLFAASPDDKQALQSTLFVGAFHMPIVAQIKD